MKSLISRISISQMITGLVLLIVSIFWSFSYYSLGKSSVELERQVRENAKAQLNTLTTEIAEIFRAHETLWRAFSRTPLIINSLRNSNDAFASLPDPEQQVIELDEQWMSVPADRTSALMDGLMANDLAISLKSRLNEYSEGYGYSIFAEVFITNKFGGNIAQTSRTTDYKQNDEMWWQTAWDEGRYLGDIGYDESAKSHSVDLALRVEDDGGNYLGVIKVVIAAKYLAARVNRFSSSLRKYSENKVTLLNGKNEIAHQSSGLFEPLADGSALMSLFADGNNSAEYTDEVSHKTQLALKGNVSGVKISSGKPWTLLIELDKERIFSVNTDLRKNLLFLGGLLTLGALSLAGLGLLTIRKKFAEVTSAAMKLASGNFDARVNATGKDELAELGNAFDYMASELENLTTDLEEGRMEAESNDLRRRIILVAAKVIEWEYDISTKELKIPLNWRYELALDELSADGQTLEKHAKGDDYKEFIDEIHKVAEGTLPVVEYQIRIREKGGEESWILARGQKVNQSTDTVGGVLINISDQKELEQRVAQVNRLESIGQLSAGIAHEINTPMQYIGDNLEFLKKACSRVHEYGLFCEETLNSIDLETVPEEIKESVEAKKKSLRIEKIRNRMPSAIDDSLDGVTAVSRIIRAMKDFSHLDDDKKTEVNLNSVVNSALNVSKSEWKYVADVETRLDETISTVPAYAGELNQVFLNIVVNAAHALGDALGPDNRKGLIIIESKDNLETGTVDVSITDNGPGIPEEVKEKIFDQFFTTKEVGKGTGQGLSICHSIITNRHGGDIRVDSKVGEGTTFTVSLPINGHQEENQEEGQ